MRSSSRDSPDAALAAVLVSLLPAHYQAQVRFATYAEARDVLAALGDILPAALKAIDPSQADRTWADWAARHDRDVRARLERGDEETIVNWLLFGTSFTKVPRVPLEASPETSREVADARFAKLVATRAADLAAALGSPGQDERRLFARDHFNRQGYETVTADDRVRLADRLVDLVYSVTSERAGIARESLAIRKSGGVSEQFVARSKLFRDRGLSLDTSFRPSFALEKTLAELQLRGLLKAGAIRDVAVIGPGLDFTDKSSGHDFYPQQTLQPFALIDSLIRVGLVRDAAAVHVTTLDISPRVNDHLRRARQRAMAGEPYRLQLPLERDVTWKPGIAEYWRTAGGRIGTATAPGRAAVPGANVDVRTVSIRPAAALRVEPVDLNIVVQRSTTHRFDLVVATNVFIYYDILDQVLALSNVRAMLKPGGFLLSNNALLELPSSGSAPVDT